MGTLKATVENHIEDTLIKSEDSCFLELIELLGLDGHFTKLRDDLDFLRQANSRAGSDDSNLEAAYQNFAYVVLGIADGLDRFIVDISTQLASDSDAVSRGIACIVADVKEGIELASWLGRGSVHYTQS